MDIFLASRREPSKYHLHMGLQKQENVKISISNGSKISMNLLPDGPLNFTKNSFKPPKMVTSCLLSILICER